MLYHGSCHCGNIGFEVEGNIEEVSVCNCSYCSKKGYLIWFIESQRVQLITPIQNLATYTSSHHNIKHQFCPYCGCSPLGFIQNDDGSSTMAINVRCIEGLETDTLKQVIGASYTNSTWCW